MVTESSMNNQKSSSSLLMFFDTFNHENDFDDIHLDLVGFPQPVAIHEVRVIPHGCRLHVDIKDKFGETAPASFKLEVFAKNLNQPNATAFENLGVLEYKDKGCFQLEAKSKITTNVVLLRGRYDCLTVCLYGEFTEIAIDSNQAPPPPPPQHNLYSMQRPPNPMTTLPTGMPNIAGIERREHSNLPLGMMKPEYGSGGIQDYSKGHSTDSKDRMQAGDTVGKEQSKYDAEGRDRGKEKSGDRKEKSDTHECRKRDSDSKEKSSDRGKRSLGSGKGSEIKSIGETTEAGDSTKDGRARAQESPSAGFDTLFDSLSSEEDFVDMPDDGANDEIGYEDIESDEDNFDDVDFEEPTDLSNFQDLDLYGSEDTWMSVSVSFNPYQCDVSSLESFEVPGLSEFDNAWKNSQKEEQDGKEDVTGSVEAKQLLSYIEECRSSPVNAKWVSMLEDIPPLLPQSLAYLKLKSNLDDALMVLVKWTNLALDLDEAMKLPVGVNIRQLKAGIKLASCLCRCDEEIAAEVMNAGVQRQLLSLLQADNMASSIRLLVIQALDSTTDMAIGIEHFLGWNIDMKNDESKISKKKSPYEDVVIYLLTNPAVRVVTALKQLLRKVHFYESLANLQNFAEKLCSNVKSEDTEMEYKKQEQDDEVRNIKKEDSDQKIEAGNFAFEMGGTMLPSDELDIIISSLHDVYKILENSQDLISQPALKSFPTSAKVIESSQNECVPTVFSLLRKRRFLESLLIIMSSPIICEPALFSTIRDMMFFLLDDEKGLIFLASEPNTVNGMIRVLTQSSEAESHPSEVPSLKELKSDANAADNCVAHQLGLLLIYHLQSLQGIDQLITAEKKGISPNEMDDANILSTLHTLYSMTFTPIGKVAVTSVLSQRDNLRCLMPFIEHTDEGEGKTRRSVSSKYASVLLLLTIQISDNIKSLEKFGSKLLAVPKKEGDSVLTELGHYLAPLDRIIRVDTNAIVNLVEYIKGELDSFKTNANSPRGVYSALRLLKHICLAPKKEQKAEQKDLKWSLAVMQLFSANAIDTFIQLLSKLGERLVTPWRQNQAFSSHHCFVLVNMTVPLLQLIHGMLDELIDSGKVPFKDARLLHGIFVLHTILCLRPVAGQLLTTISQIRSEIVSILLKFTTTTTAPESQEVLRASSWYLMLKELVAYTCSKPQAFLSGVVLLSELLPVPFPVNTAQELAQEDLKTLSNHRLLWVAHIGTLGNEIQSMLKSLIGSCCTYLQHSLRKLCLQLCDLGAITSLSTIRFLCEALNDALSKAAEKQEQLEDKEKEQKEDSSNICYATRVISLLSTAISQPGGKLAFLHLTRQAEENDESEFGILVQRMINVLKCEKKRLDTSALIEGILGIFVSLCDAQITINEYQDPFKPQHLANNLPDAKTLQEIASTTLSFSCDPEQQYQLIAIALRVLMTYTEHNHGMLILQKGLEEEGKLFNLIERLEKDISGKENQDDVMNVFSTFIGFVRFLLPLTKIEEENDQRNEEFAQTIRKVHVTSATLRRYLKLDDATDSHPLFTIKKQLKDDSKDDMNADSLHDLTLLIEHLQKDEKPADDESQSNVQLPNPQTIHELYDARLLNMTTMIEDDRLAPMSWYLSPPPEDMEADMDMVILDLEAIAEKYCPGFNLKEEVEKGFISTDDQSKRTKRSKRKFDPLVHGKGDHVDDSKRQRLDVSWLQRGRGNFRGRGRGFGRGYVDTFRFRKQNTSRPPSMHVDDFIAMENSASPSDNQNKQPIKSSFGGPVRTATSEPRFTGGFTNSDGRWGSPAQGSFRREVDHTEMNRAGFGTWGGQSTFTPHYGRGNAAFQRGGSSWSPQIPSPYRAPRESQSAYPRSSFRGGYWAGPKPKEDNSRFFAGGALGNYRQNQGAGRDGFNRHMRTFTR